MGQYVKKVIIHCLRYSLKKLLLSQIMGISIPSYNYACLSFLLPFPAKLECDGGMPRPCPESVCHSAQNSCNKNPCAVCSVDPCTCQPKFVDALTGEDLSREQCSYSKCVDNWFILKSNLVTC